jgi:hypothetical protein
VAFPQEKFETISNLSGRYEYQGLIRPNEEICIRWWEREKYDAWIAKAKTA